MSFLGSIGMELWADGGVGKGRVPADGWVLGPAGGLRLGILGILADMVLGMPPGGRTASTADLAVGWTASPPASGGIVCTGRVLKSGQRLTTGDALVADEEGCTVGWAAGTFITASVAVPTDASSLPRQWGAAGGRSSSVEEALHAERQGPGVVDLPMRAEVVNGPGGTVQGGIQTVLAELAAEGAVPGMRFVSEIAIRYLRRAKVGPLRATASSLPGRGPSRRVRVELVDIGHEDRLVSVVVAVVRESP